jgi:NAD(P)-dependent dehydrogenase (short-subunit alcohol dehydrogenase family)
VLGRMIFKPFSQNRGNMREQLLIGKVALITGSAKGIGRASAIALAEAGADVILGLRDISRSEKVEEEIEQIGRRVLKVQMDISRLDQIKDAVDESVHQFGHIDILVNNAGIGAPNKAEDVNEKDFDSTINVNLKGTFFTAQAVGREMIKQKSGTIINLSSQAGFIALETESIYCMTKAAISHLTKCLALEWAKHNVTVNAVAPTFIRTPGTVTWLGDKKFYDSVIKRIPIGRVGEPNDIAEIIVFLASPKASLITGATIMADGGWTIQ